MQYQAVSGEIKVSAGTTEADPSNPQLLTLASGNIAVFWGSENAEMMEVLDARGHIISPAVTLEPDVGPDIGLASFLSASFTATPDGGFAAAWKIQTTNADLTVGQHIEVQRFDAGGHAIGAEVQVDGAVSAGAFLYPPSIASLADGTLAVSYGTASGQVFADTVAATGTVMLRNQIAGSGTSHALLALDGGGFVESYQDMADGGIFVRLQFYDASDAPVGAPVLLSDAGGEYDGGVPETVLAQLANGDIVAVWLEDDTGNTHVNTLYGQLIDAGHAKIGNPFTIASSVYDLIQGSALSDISVAALATGGFVVDWNNVPRYNHGTAIAQFFAADGTTDGSSVSPGDVLTGGQYHTQITALIAGGFAIGWLDDPDVTDSLPSVIKAQVYGLTNATADFNGDGHSDILWRNDNGAFTEWQVAGNVAANQLTPNTYGNGTVGTDWHIAETLDFNGDGASDILWRNGSAGAFTVWEGAGDGFTQNAYTDATVGADWSIAAVGDFNGDGRDDIAWRNGGSGAVTIWSSTGTDFTPNTFSGWAPTDWQIVGSGDFDGDGKADLLWRNQTSGKFVDWLSTGTDFTHDAYSDSSVGLAWHVDAIADFDGDGKADLLWRNDVDGSFTLWTSTGTGFTPNTYANDNVGLGWQIAQVGDFNDDGKADILWRNAATGSFTLWQSNGNGFDENVAVQSGVGGDWHVQGHDYLYG